MTSLPPEFSNAPLLTGALPPINPAMEPKSIRDGSPEAKKAYQVGLSFEQLLVGQLAQELTTTISGSSDGSSNTGTGSDGGSADTSSGGSGGVMGSDPASSAYASLIPDALTSSIMSGGGLGIAMKIAQSIDPSLEGKR